MTVILWLSIALTVSVLTVLLREDWLHFSRPRRRVDATVVRHHRQVDDGAESFAAVLQFRTDDGALNECTDIVYSPVAKPAIGTVRTMDYPMGHPQSARISRPLWRAAAYLALTVLLAILVLRLVNWIQ